MTQGAKDNEFLGINEVVFCGGEFVCLLLLVLAPERSARIFLPAKCFNGFVELFSEDMDEVVVVVEVEVVVVVVVVEVVAMVVVVKDTSNCQVSSIS